MTKFINYVSPAFLQDTTTNCYVAHLNGYEENDPTFQRKIHISNLYHNFIGDPPQLCPKTVL